MQIEKNIPLLEEILGVWSVQLGKDLPGYRNHVYRMANFCFALRPCTGDDRQKIAIAGAFHDLGIWSDGTIDYLPPSTVRAHEYLERNDLLPWSEEIELMIDLHHKLQKYADPKYPLVEAFRKADLVDVSLGLVKFGLPAGYVKEVKAAFPNAGFHKKLSQLAGGWFRRHPASLPPFLKW